MRTPHLFLGPDAAHAFQLGVVVDIIIGLTSLGMLYLSGTIPLWIAGYGR